MNKIISAYTVAILGGALWISYVANRLDPEKYDFSTYWLIFLIIIAVLFSPFIILTWVAYKKKKRVLQSVAKGVAIWTFIFLLPLIVINSLSLISQGKMGGIPLYIFSVAQLLVSLYLVQHYSLVKSFILPAILLPGVFNLYLLIYGIFKQNKF